MDPQLARVLAPGYLSGLVELPLAQVRAMRAECQAIENALSYVRRLAQGRLDIVGAELERRRAGGDPNDVRSLIAQLPDILVDRGQPAGLPRPPQDMSAEDVADAYIGEVDAILNPATVGSVTELSDADLAQVRDRLEAYERDTSGRRHALHGIVDRLQAEIARRYRTGEASVDTLLQ